MSDLNVVDMSGDYPYLAKGTLDNVQGLVVHHTASSDSATPQDIAAGWKKSGDSAQYIMGRDGTVYQMMPQGSKAYQIVPSWNPKIPWANNSTTEGIELIAKDDGDVTPAQTAALQQFALQQAQQYGFDPATNVIGHGEVNGSGSPAGTNPNYLREPTEGMTAVNSLRDYLKANPSIEAQYNPALTAINQATPLAVPSNMGLGYTDTPPDNSLGTDYSKFYGNAPAAAPGTPINVLPTDPFLARAQQGGLTPSSGNAASMYGGIDAPPIGSYTPSNPNWTPPVVPQAIASQSAPTPLPLPSFAAPVVPTSPQTPGQHLVRLASGKMIATGIYGDTTITDDGNGNAVPTVTRSPLAAGPGTMVGGIASSMADNAIKQTVVPQIQNAVSGVQAGLSGVGSQAGNLLGGLGSAASGLLGSLFKPVPSVSAAITQPGYTPSNPNWTDSVVPQAVQNPMTPPPLTAPGSYTPSNPNLMQAPMPYPEPSFAAPQAGPTAPTPYPTPSFAAPVVSRETNYTVRPGDTLNSIAQRTGVPISNLASQVNNPNLIMPGQQLSLYGTPQAAPQQAQQSVVPQRIQTSSSYTPPSVSGYYQGSAISGGYALDPNGSGRLIQVGQ